MKQPSVALKMPSKILVVLGADKSLESLEGKIAKDPNIDRCLCWFSGNSKIALTPPYTYGIDRRLETQFIVEETTHNSASLAPCPLTFRTG